MEQVVPLLFTCAGIFFVLMDGRTYEMSKQASKARRH
jgi:hypothetical protein